MMVIMLGPKRRNGHRPGDVCGVHEIGGGILAAPVWWCDKPAYRGWRCKKHWNEWLGIAEADDNKEEVRDMMNDIKQFDGFIGVKVNVAKSEHTMVFGGKEYTFPHYTLDENEPNIAAIKHQHPFLRVWLPDTMGTMDHNMGRLNVYIEEDVDGGFYIKSFSYG